MAWLFVPGLGESSSGCGSPCPTIEPCVTWRGKPMRPQRLSAAWKTAAWLRRLSGMTLPPSTAARGVAEFISSLPAFRASRSVPPACGVASRTNAGSGRISSGSFARYDRRRCSWRMCPKSGKTRSPWSSAHWPLSGSMRNGTCFLRPAAEPRINGSGCFCWLTPRASDASRGRTDLAKTVALGRMQLRDQVRLPSPTAYDATPGGPGNHHHGLGYRARFNLWPTPNATGMLRGEKYTHASYLRSVANGHSRHLTQEAAPGGLLNPTWVEWLMGWPLGWTDCRRAATASFRKWLRAHGAC